MSLALLMGFQAAAAAAPAPAADVAPVDFDLRHYRASDSSSDLLGACPRGEGATIVVCGRRRAEPYPLEEMARIYEPRPLRAETSLGDGVTGNVHVEQVRFPDGSVANRIMVGIKLPF
jgi:hypothetical protein